MLSFLNDRYINYKDKYDISSNCKLISDDTVDTIVSFLPLTTQVKVSNHHKELAKKHASLVIAKYIDKWSTERINSCFPLCKDFDLQMPCADCIRRFTPLNNRTKLKPILADTLTRFWLDDIFTMLDILSEEEFDSSETVMNITNVGQIVDKYKEKLVRYVWLSTTNLPYSWTHNNNELDAIEDDGESTTPYYDYYTDTQYLLSLVRDIEIDIYDSIHDTSQITPILTHNSAIQVLLCASNLCFYKCREIIEKWSWDTLLEECNTARINIIYTMFTEAV